MPRGDPAQVIIIPRTAVFDNGGKIAIIGKTRWQLLSECLYLAAVAIRQLFPQKLWSTWLFGIWVLPIVYDPA